MKAQSPSVAVDGLVFGKYQSQVDGCIYKFMRGQRTMSSVFSLQRSDLNEFLFADVGTEASGMMLSVVSLFARQGNDPWREAGRLADLPKDAAADSLAHDIAEMPQGRWNLCDAAAISGRLIGLLPARPARVDALMPLRAADWKFSARSAIMLACIALSIAYVFSGMMRPGPAGGYGSDAAFVSASAPGDVSRTGASIPR